VKCYVLSDPLRREPVRGALEELGHSVVQACEPGSAADLSRLLGDAEATGCELVVLELAGGGEDDAGIAEAVRRFRITRPEARMIVLLPEGGKPDGLTTELVSMGVYDLLAVGDALLPTVLGSTLADPATYAHAARWQVRTPLTESRKRGGRSMARPAVERTVETLVERVVGCVVIAVAGVGSRVGTTHLALSLARTLADDGHPVAAVMTNEAHWRSIAAGYEGVVIDEGRSRFELDGLALYLGAPARPADYRYIVLDLGVYDAGDAVEFKRSPVRVLVSGSTEWDLAETTALLRADTQVAGYTFGFTFTSPELAEYIAANMPGVSVIPVPYNPDWTSVGGVSDALRALVAGVVPSGAGAGGR